MIESMRLVEQIGYLAPLTESGTIVTNNITSSCCNFSQTSSIWCLCKCVIILDPSFPHHLADLALMPAKMFPELLLDNQESLETEGTRTYVRYLKWTARYCSLLTCNLSKTQLMDIIYLIFYKSMNVSEPLELVLEERIKQKRMEFTC